PAARLGLVGDQVIILSYCLMEPEEAKNYKAKVIHLDENNKIKD
ncbi:MAG: aspartate 1-decarboxylase, partial [Candidatus Omnitrophica bacterium]|nr:aspartate 1-decarboxylase [Candidatus Omnitrophota bacterium]